VVIYSTPFVCSNQNIPPPLSPWTIICFLVIFLLVVDSSVFFQLMVSDSTTLLSFVVCRRAHFLFTLFVFACVKCCPTHYILSALKWETDIEKVANQLYGNSEAGTTQLIHYLLNVNVSHFKADNIFVRT
jgi:hypothetical protein